jgi:uncharacterized protein
MPLARRHVLSIDDAPFRKFRDADVLVVGVVTAGKGLIEGILTTRLPVDGPSATEHLAAWVSATRFRPVLRALIINGITIAGLSVVDGADLARRTGLPVICVNRKAPSNTDLIGALRTAGFPDRIPIVERSGQSRPHGGVHVASWGIEPGEAAEILDAEAGRSRLPEGIRIAHIIGQGMVLGESRGRP